MARAKALIGLAGLCYWQGDWDAAEAAGHARELAKGLDDWVAGAGSLVRAGLHAGLPSGRAAGGAPIEQQFQAIIAEHPEPLAIGLGLATSQMMRLFAGDLDGSRQYGEQCLPGPAPWGAVVREPDPAHPGPHLHCRAATSKPRASCGNALTSPWSWEIWPGWPSTWIGWDRPRWPSDTPNERSSWPRPPTASVSPSAVDSRWSQAGGRPSIHEMPPDNRSPTPRSTERAQDAP